MSQWYSKWSQSKISKQSVSTSISTSVIDTYCTVSRQDKAWDLWVTRPVQSQDIRNTRCTKTCDSPRGLARRITQGVWGPSTDLNAQRHRASKISREAHSDWDVCDACGDSIFFCSEMRGRNRAGPITCQNPGVAGERAQLHARVFQEW